MGACCSSSASLKRVEMEEERKRNRKRKMSIKEEHCIRNEDGSNVRFKGSSKLVSMSSQQGKKGINQDAMAVWENFNGEKGAYFCAVYDGHGPFGHKVAQEVRDLLPSKLCSSLFQSKINGPNDNHYADEKNKDKGEVAAGGGGVHNNPLFSSWKESLIRSFEEMDNDLGLDDRFDTYYSGCTAVTVLKQNDQLVVANSGDSRAVICSRDEKNQLIPVQLTVDMKPNLPNEAERIRNNKGRVFAMEEEPEVYRIWMPEENCPGLAMARAFGDFCLKGFGLIPTPEVYYRKLTNKDEFVVLATDGVWDVLSNIEVINIVASARKRSIAARLLVNRAVRAWRHKYPNSLMDDCTVICLFLKERPLLGKSISDGSQLSISHSEFGAVSLHPKNIQNYDGLDNAKSSMKLCRSSSHGAARQDE